MRRLVVVTVVLVAGCGGNAPSRAATTAGSATTAGGATTAGAAPPAGDATTTGTAPPAGTASSAGPSASAAPPPFDLGARWSAAVAARFAPLPCPVASSRVGDPNRVVALGGGRFARLAGPYTELADVDARGRELRHVAIGTGRGEVTTWAMTCGTAGQLAAAWVEDGTLRLVRRPRDGALSAPVTLARQALDETDRGEIALSFAPGGDLLVVYAVPYAVHAITVSASGAVGADVVLGRSNGITQVAAEFAANGRAVVAWDTQDGGEERNSPHVVRAATRAKGGLFRPAQIVDPGGAVDADQYINDPRAAMRLAVAPNGRAIVIYGAVTGTPSHYGHPLRVAESSPTGRFRTARELTSGGHPGDVAIRSDGTALAVWRDAGRLRAAIHKPGSRFEPGDPVAGPAATDAPTASFLPDGRAQLTWIAGGKTFTTTRP